MSTWFGLVGFLILIVAVFGKIAWGWGIWGAFLLYISIARFWTKYKAASNAVIAKYTFANLTNSEQLIVLASVKNVMSNAALPINDPEETLKGMTPEQRYGFIALGMLSIGIAPKFGGGWYDVRNPYAEILRANREIAWVKHQLKIKHGVNVEFENA